MERQQWYGEWNHIEFSGESRLCYDHPHIAKNTLNFLEASHVKLLPWSLRSSDLSPIEHVWNMVYGLLMNWVIRFSLYRMRYNKKISLD